MRFSSYLCLLALVGCGGADAPTPTLTLSPQATLRVEASGTPSVAWDPAHGTTTVVAKWVARRDDGSPLGPDDVSVSLLLDNAELDSEVILQQGSKPLAVNLLYGMVLDATYSMMQHQPPAFEPMKQAAQKSVQTGTALWADRPGSFRWTASWFDDYVYRPEAAWSDNALLSIPTPTPGAFTRLYAAVDFGIQELVRVRGDVQVDNPQNVLVVFSDGRDNHSQWTPPASDALVERGDGLAYRKLGWPAISLNDVLAKITNHPDLTVHTLGMGTDVNDAELQAIADAGHGIYAKNPHSDGVAALFERVTKEFTTLQMSGASLLNAPGDHNFSVVVTDLKAGTHGKLTFPLHVGDEQARLLPP